MADPKTLLKKLLGYKSESAAIGRRGLGYGKSTAKKRIGGDPTVKSKSAAMKTGRVVFGTQVRAVAVPVKKKDKCDPTSEYWDEETQSCKPIRDKEEKDKSTVGFQAGTARWDEPMQTKPEIMKKKISKEEQQRLAKEYPIGGYRK